MIFVTGDTHIPIDISKLNMANFPIQRELTKDDYVVILGDFGGVWGDINNKLKLSGEDKWWLDNLTKRNFTTLFIDGNHENFDLLSTFPKVSKFNNICTQITESIFWLNRGNIYTIDSKRIFTFGGARSIDRSSRKPKVSWWKQEMPTVKEMAKGLQSLELSSWKVDYVFTHCAPTTCHNMIVGMNKGDNMTDYLQTISEKIHADMWFCGHYHRDITLPVKDDFKLKVLYDDIILLSGADNYD